MITLGLIFASSVHKTSNPMKKIVYTVLILTITVLFTSCGPKISGKDEASFTASKAKMEEKLNANEKIDLEKALRVLLAKAMTEKFNGKDGSKGKSFDQLVMGYVDGKTFSGIVDAAEDYLKKDNKEKIDRAKAEIDSLNKTKVKLQAETKVLDQFKLTKMEITEGEFFDEKVPYLELTFVNGTGDEIIGEHMIMIYVYAKSTGKVLMGMGTGGTYSEGEGLKPNETDEVREVLSTDARNQAEKFWKTAKYPVKDFALADLEVKAYASVLTTKKGGKVVRPRELENMDKRIQELQVELKEREASKGSLEELELTK